MVYFVGVDIGGTNVVCGVTDAEGTLLGKRKERTAISLGAEGVAEQIAGMIRDCLEEQGISPELLAAVGVGTPGFLCSETGVVHEATNLGWHHVPLAELLRVRLGGVSVFIDNDVRMYVYGEAVCGAGRGYRHVLGLTLGTGMSASFVVDGDIYHGGGAIAGELGHIVMDGVTFPCTCGMTGCLETVASATGMARVAQLERPDLLTAAQVSQAYDEGDEAAVRAYRYVGVQLGRALAGVVAMLSPDVIVIGGGGSLAGERILGPIREELSQRLHPMYRDRLLVTAASMNDDAGVVGSAMLAKRRLP